MSISPPSDRAFNQSRRQLYRDVLAAEAAMSLEIEAELKVPAPFPLGASIEVVGPVGQLDRRLSIWSLNDLIINATHAGATYEEVSPLLAELRILTTGGIA